jgi:DNA-binding SARP family transcriptional activator
VTGLRFNLLGSFEVRGRGGELVRLPAGRARTVLALLSLRAGREAASHWLIDAAWNGAPPATAATRLHGLISDLRRALPTEAGAVILTSGAGYLLDVPAEQIDLFTARRMISLARAHREQGAVTAAARTLAEAVGLWRGTPFDGIDCAELQAEAALIEQAQADGLEELAELELELGRPAVVAARLAPWAARYPLREGLVGCLIRALAGSGRQAEAIAAYHQLRGRLADQLGVDPVPRLQELYRSILDGDRAVLTPKPGAPPRGRPPSDPADTAETAGRAGSWAEARAGLQRRYDELDPELARVFRMLGIGGSPLFCAGQAAALCDLSVDRANRFLDGLAEVRLLESPAVGVYRMREPLWGFATGLADASVPRRESERAMGRLVDWYRGVAVLRAPERGCPEPPARRPAYWPAPLPAEEAATSRRSSGRLTR